MLQRVDPKVWGSTRNIRGEKNTDMLVYKFCDRQKEKLPSFPSKLTFSAKTNYRSFVTSVAGGYTHRNTYTYTKYLWS